MKFLNISLKGKKIFGASFLDSETDTYYKDYDNKPFWICADHCVHYVSSSESDYDSDNQSESDNECHNQSNTQDTEEGEEESDYDSDNQSESDYECHNQSNIEDTEEGEEESDDDSDNQSESDNELFEYEMRKTIADIGKRLPEDINNKDSYIENALSKPQLQAHTCPLV